MAGQEFSLNPTAEELNELHQLEAPEPSFEQQLTIRYHELLRDKRGLKDIDCATWNNGCHCPSMVVGHTSKQGRPWCPACQNAHDGPPHPIITHEQFMRRFRKEE